MLLTFWEWRCHWLEFGRLKNNRLWKGYYIILLWQPLQIVTSWVAIIASKIPLTEQLASYSPWGHKELEMTEWLRTHTGGFKTSEIILAQFWRPEDWNQRIGMATFPLKSLGENLSSSSFLGLLMVLDFCQHNSDTFSYVPMAFSHVSIFSPLVSVRTMDIGLTLIQDDLILKPLTYIYCQSLLLQMRSLSEILNRYNFRENIIKLLQAGNKCFHLGMQDLRFVLHILVEMPSRLLNLISRSRQKSKMGEKN